MRTSVPLARTAQLLRRCALVVVGGLGMRNHEVCHSIDAFGQDAKANGPPIAAASWKGPERVIAGSGATRQGGLSNSLSLRPRDGCRFGKGRGAQRKPLMQNVEGRAVVRVEVGRVGIGGHAGTVSFLER